MAEVKDVLLNAYTYIKGGWVKKTYHDVVRSHDCFCSLGAIRQATFGRVMIPPNDIQRPIYEKAVQLLYRALSPRGRSQEPESHIIQFNDSPKTKKTDVTAVFRKAIKLAEAA